ncbi:hypothetical protein BDP27DRAFT_1418562 [Rhodocollybia butyracea]|uniref:Uncharacterized protein n=1 Tax=Rhodocollybia butyracea TaxID=206335 RepID=A0A9P5UBD3_9AGAR|nr:hypothetical protein BDP27DRAFT_1374019 [Rhodocollybia butyracea]KAF9071988.1 hypothetical protein BDP27DRAFT_1418562 [Rhodocollybia butyracea]
MQSVARYPRIQTISWMHFIFLLLVFIAPGAYAAPRRDNSPHGDNLVRVYFVNNGGSPIIKGQLPKEDRDNLSRVRLETSTAQLRVLEILRLIGSSKSESLSLPGPIEETIRWSDSNFYYPERMALRNVRNNVHEMQAFLRIQTMGETYYAWIAYGSHREYGMSAYGSIMQVVGKQLNELARVTDTTDVKQAEWEYLHRRFTDRMKINKKFTGGMTVILEKLDFSSLKSDTWTSTPLVPIEISFMTAQGEVVPHTAAKKWETLRVLQVMRHTLVIPQILPENFYHWADSTVFPTVSETNALTFLRLKRPDFGVAYGWIAPVDNTRNGKCLYASIMKNGTAIQEIARVIDLKDVDGKKKWNDLNDRFLETVNFFDNKKGPFMQTPEYTWSMPPLSDKDFGMDWDTRIVRRRV